MAQSPIVITGLSSEGKASAFLGGVHRDHLQIVISLAAASSNPGGHLSVVQADSADYYQDNNLLYTLSGPASGTQYISSEMGGFFNHVNVVAWGGFNSDYYAAVTVKIYFDGPQWPST